MLNVRIWYVSLQINSRRLTSIVYHLFYYALTLKNSAVSNLKVEFKYSTIEPLGVPDMLGVLTMIGRDGGSWGYQGAYAFS